MPDRQRSLTQPNQTQTFAEGFTDKETGNNEILRGMDPWHNILRMLFTKVITQREEEQLSATAGVLLIILLAACRDVDGGVYPQEIASDTTLQLVKQTLTVAVNDCKC